MKSRSARNRSGRSRNFKYLYTHITTAITFEYHVPTLKEVYRTDSSHNWRNILYLVAMKTAGDYRLCICGSFLWATRI
ncbi:MAG: hypothetical protein ACLR2O_16245 [Coprococcus sp.]